ncbi:hypothetical protein L2E82_40828 [Cichorium intybus]|uniref:Uncharacterized protein n=1 Tax=Cichorium intybus TaxID=13427 RepID=A0ACB9ANF1_CICIN|nr:hypothetical protein L2E82_40828 [Cichorium intybus]
MEEDNVEMKFLIHYKRLEKSNWFDFFIFSHWKPFGTFLLQTLRSKLRDSGTFRLIPRTFALIAEQRQTAASRSTRPSMRLQHGLTGGFPTTRPSRLPRTLAHTPSLRVSLGHVPVDGFGFGVGPGRWCNHLLVQRKEG